MIVPSAHYPAYDGIHRHHRAVDRRDQLDDRLLLLGQGQLGFGVVQRRLRQGQLIVRRAVSYLSYSWRALSRLACATSSTYS